MVAQIKQSVATSNPVSTVVLLERLDGGVVCAGLLLTWGGGRAAQMALCAAGACLRDLRDLRIVLPPNDGGPWTTLELAAVAVGGTVEATSSISVIRLKREPFGGSAWGFGKLARSPMVSVDGLAVGTSAFLPVLTDRDGGRLGRPLLLERSVAGRDGDMLLINAESAPCLAGTPVFVRRPSWPRASGVGLRLGGFLVESPDDRLSVCRMEHVSELLGEQSRWKHAEEPGNNQIGTAALRDDGSAADRRTARGAGVRALPEEVNPLIAAFLVESAATGRFSKATLKARRYDLFMLDRWARESGLDAADLTEDQLGQYFRLRREDGLSPLTLVRARSSADRFYAHLVARGARGDAPLERVAQPGPAPRPKLVLAEHEARALLDQPDRSSVIGRRDRAILEVLYATAIKPNELVSLKIEDIDLQGGKLRLYARRHGAKVLPLNGPARSALKEHLLGANRAGCAAPTDLVFTGPKGSPLPYTRVGAIARRHAVSAGVKERVTGSTLRNSAANHLLRRGVDRKAVAAFLGVRDGGELDAYGSVDAGRRSRA